MDIYFGRLQFDVLVVQLHKSAMESILISEKDVDDIGNWHTFELLSSECECLVCTEGEGRVILWVLLLCFQRCLYLIDIGQVN